MSANTWEQGSGDERHHAKPPENLSSLIMNPTQETEVMTGDGDDVSVVLPNLGRGISHVQRAIGRATSADENREHAEETADRGKRHFGIAIWSAAAAKFRLS